MQTVSCPSCGAPVQFRSHAAVVAVCEFCQTTVMKDAGSVKDLGKMSSVLEDFTRIQIGTSGVHGGRSFNVVGRIQLRYSAGMWNEWFILYDDGATAWLGDSSGLYVITSERKIDGAVPSFDEIAPGRHYQIGALRFTASEKRVADCIGGQGELPFRVGEGWQAKVADFRDEANFITLDYSEGDPLLFIGQAVTLEDMQCQLLREDDQIKESTGKFRGKVDALECPSCGTGIKYVPGLTSNLLCPSCHAQLDAAGPQAQILAQGEKVESVRLTIPLGSVADISSGQYTTIGAMVRVDEENTPWTEYLLYNPKAQFFWLIETNEGWSRTRVLSTWPQWASVDADSATLDKQPYRKLYDYRATVRFAAGAFNWRVAAGDIVHVYEYESGQTRLAAELTAEELTWSRSTPVPFEQVRAWFGLDKSKDPLAGMPPQKLPRRGLATKFVMWILGLNAIPLLFNFGGSFWIVLIALFALFYPAKYFQGDGEQK